MDIELKNARFVQPFVEVVNLTVQVFNLVAPRGADVILDEFENVTEILLPKKPINKAWVEVYKDGFRMVNPSLDFGVTHQDFEIVGQTIQFHEPQTGTIKVIVDFQTNPLQLAPDNTVVIKNRQGAKTKGKNPGDLYASYFCTPMVLAEPHNGYVRVSDDGLGLVYYPNRSYEGFDSFSYTVVNERGQIAEPKCVFVKVGNARVRP